MVRDMNRRVDIRCLYQKNDLHRYSLAFANGFHKTICGVMNRNNSINKQNR